MSFGFGAGGFGAPQQNSFQTPFAQGAAVTPAASFAGGFGGAQPNTAFGGPPVLGAASSFATPAASQYPAAPVFGGGGFPQQGAAAGGFAQQQNTGFGVPQATGFGSQVGTGTFGAAHQQVGFGSTVFAAAPQGGFGAAAPAAGFAAPTGGFGAAPGNSFGASSFGGAQNSGAFGASGFGAAPATSFNTVGGSGFQGSQQSGFVASQGIKKEGDNSGIVNSICANMRDQSLESQRFLDYQANRKGPTQGSFGTGVGVGSTVVGVAPFGQQASSFGQPQTGLAGFGQQQVGFGGQQQQLQQKPAFGSSANVFGTTSTTANASQATAPFGATGAASSLFPATGATPFGVAAPLTTNLFGAGSQPSVPGLQAAPAPFALGGGTALGVFGAASNSGATTAFTGFGTSSAAPFALNSAVPGFGIAVGGSAVANSSAQGVQVPITVPTVSAPASEAKYADAYASRIQLEDTEVGRRRDSAVYARHHSVPVSRDQPPTFIWQTPGKSTKASASRNSGSSTPRHSSGSSRYNADSTSSRGAALIKNDLIVDAPDSLKALNLLHSAILPAWNELFYSGYSKEDVLRDWKCNNANPHFNSVTEFSLYDTKTSPLKGRLIPNYTVQTFSGTQGYQLVAESRAVRHGCDSERTREEVPVTLKMTVSGDSFQTLLEMIVRRYKNYKKSQNLEPFSEDAVLCDMRDGTPFYPFDIYFEYATPQCDHAPKASRFRHLPKFLFMHELREAEKVAEIERREREMIESVPQFYGFPTASDSPGNIVSGASQIFGGSHADFQEYKEYKRKNHQDLSSLCVQPHPDIPKLYLSIGCPVIADMPKPATMDLQFVAHFSRDRFIKFDERFSEDQTWKKFLIEFHKHFEFYMKSRQFGDFTYEDPHNSGRCVRQVYPLHALQPLQSLPSADETQRDNHILEGRFNFLRENMKDAVWQFWASHSFEIPK